jgi:hypothetical protein
MLAGDTERACRAMSRHLDAFRRWMGPSTSQFADE